MTKFHSADRPTGQSAKVSHFRCKNIGKLLFTIGILLITGLSSTTYAQSASLEISDGSISTDGRYQVILSFEVPSHCNYSYTNCRAYYEITERESGSSQVIASGPTGGLPPQNVIDREVNNGTYDYRGYVRIETRYCYGGCPTNPDEVEHIYTDYVEIEVIKGYTPEDYWGFSNDYEIRTGDINGDSRTDFYIRKNPQADTTAVKDFILRGFGTNSYVIMGDLSSSQRSQASMWVIPPSVNLVPVDINMDGYRDIYIRGINSSTQGNNDIIVYAPSSENSSPGTFKKIDDALAQFVSDSYGWFKDKDYFELTALENGWYHYDGNEATGWWYIRYISYYYSYDDGKRFLDENDDPEDEDNTPAFCIDYPSNCTFDFTAGAWLVYGTFLENIEIVFEYENFNQDAIQLSQANPNSPSAIEQKIEEMMNEEFGGVFADLILNEENPGEYSDDVYYGEFEKLLSSQAALHNIYCVLSEDNCIELKELPQAPGVDILVNREEEGSNYTQGKYRVVGEACQYSGNIATGVCGYTLEREGPDSTVEGSNKRIQAGTYPFSYHWGNKYQGVPGLEDVAGRSAILIHAGNFPYNTSGCILIGKRLSSTPGKIERSGDAMTELINNLNSNGFYGTVSIENGF